VSLGCFFFIASLQKKRMVISLHPIRTTLAAGQLDLILQVKISRTLKFVNIPTHILDFQSKIYV